VKRLMPLLLVVLAVPAAATAAISGVGGGTTIANGQATLVSNATEPYSFISFDDLNGQTVGALDWLSANVASADYGGGSPRFSIELSTGKNIFVYLGDLPNLAGGGTGDTNNLLADGARIDTSQIGGTFYDTWSDAQALAGSATIAGIDFVVDSGWAQPSGSQTVVLDAVSIDGTVYTFSAAAKSDCKDGNWQTLGYKNQGDCVSSVETGR
jgi:hypothetical protein